MRIQSRVFTREYKTRSSKLANSLIQQMIPQEFVSENEPISFALPHRSHSTTRSRAVHQEAEAVFKPKAIEHPLNQNQPGGEQRPVVTGRILPCLSKLADTHTPAVKGKARLKDAGTRGKTTPTAETQSKKKISSSSSLHSSNLSLKMRSHIVSEEFARLSDLELLSLIERAKQEIVNRQNQGREKLKEEIQARLANSGLDISDLFPDLSGKGRRKSSKDADKSDVAPVPAKYRDPVSQESWSGRGGRPPHWVKKIMDEKGWSLEDFKKSGEYEI